MSSFEPGDPTPRTNWEKLLDHFTRASYLLVGLAITWIGENGADGGFIRDIWAQAKVASPLAAMLLIVLYFDEKRERRKAQRQCNDRTVEFIQSNNTTHAAMEKSSLAHRAGMERIAGAYAALSAKCDAILVKLTKRRRG